MTIIAPSATEPQLERELFALVRRERRARDSGDWTTMANLYWPDSVVRVTWFEGTAEGFIDGSRATRAAGRPGGIHPINPAWSEVRGDRALVESQGQIVIRPRLDGVQVDVTSWCRFFSRLERRAGEWRLRSFDSIYGKDRLDPVVPGQSLDIDVDELTTGRASYQFLTYLNNRSGRPVPQDLPGDDRPDLLEAFYADAREWLELGDDAVEGRWRPASS
ncbi:nuclear transport factor 2 family protein [Actinotalea sp. M2MS4P-6]|uniref:nuclear transport factor 2 family protein n=1 Tax=Actinotalea sp. M2MS4P-6 TaxID=2983762 RepID=UPI0021E38D23|nr:nuclear transport factor 2 family protein [Actinotalea sp. M2MS4P-6]MCV2394342.1 nuclear transport factor 2 family protein [Actinotalea sp. M2MS4P-6]